MSARLDARVVPPKPHGDSPEGRRVLLSLGYEPIPIHAESKACYVKGWTEAEITPERLDAMQAERPDDVSTGCRTGKLAVADIDLTNPDQAAEASEEIQAILGLCMFTRIGNKPGGALCYFNREPLHKITVSGRPPGAAKDEKIEFLGTGQQLVAYGFHSGKGADYEWPNFDLFDTKLEDLPPVSPDMIRQAARVITALFMSWGYTDVKRTGDTGENGSAGQSTGEPVTATMLEEMLSYIDPACDRLEWIAIAGAIKSARVIDLATNDDDQTFDAADLFDRWSSGELNDGHRPGNYLGRADCDKAFDSVTATRSGGAGVGTIVKRARDGGYGGKAHISTMERLYGGAKDAPEVPDDTPADIPQDAARVEETENRWPGLIFTGDAIAQIKPPVPIIPGYFLSEGITGILAKRRTGKTVNVLDVGLCVASNKPWCGEPIIGVWHVVYLCGEDHANAAAHVQAWCKENSDGLVPDRFIFVGDVPDLLASDNHDVTDLVAAIRQKLPKDARVVWIIDTWQRATLATDENEARDMRRAIKNAGDLHTTFKGPTLVCFHPPKSDPHTISGTMFQENVLAAMWIIEREKPDDKRDPCRMLTVDNIKGRGEGNFKLFEFSEVALGKPDLERGIFPAGVYAKHTGGTGEPAENKIERLRKEQAKDQEAIDVVFEVVKEILADGKRVLNQNNARSSAVQLSDLVTILENDHGLTLAGNSHRAKCKEVRRYLDKLTSRADGRLDYREAAKTGHGTASYFLTDEGKSEHDDDVTTTCGNDDEEILTP